MEELQQENKTKRLGLFTLERKQSQISSALIKEGKKTWPGKGSAGLSASLDLTQSGQKKENQTIPTPQTKNF